MRGLATLFLTIAVASGCKDRPIAYKEPRFKICGDTTRPMPYVTLDSNRVLLVCASVLTRTLGDYRATPLLLLVGDTLFTDAVVEKAIGDYLANDAIGTADYRAFYGPLRPGIRFRITNRLATAPLGVPFLDTTVGVPR